LNLSYLGFCASDIFRKTTTKKYGMNVTVRSEAPRLPSLPKPELSECE
jgi:hypothetical protein